MEKYETEETLRAEVKLLKEKCERLEYEAAAKKDDLAEAMTSEVAHLRAALDGKLLNIQPGDILLVDSQKILQASPGMFMQLAKKYGCVFVSMPDGGIDAISKLTNDQLEGLNLRKITDEEKTTGSHKIKNMEIEMDTALHTVGDSASAEFKSHLLNAVRALKSAYAAVLWLEQNNQKPVETAIPTGALLA